MEEARPVAGRENGEGRKLILVTGSRFDYWDEPDEVQAHLNATLDWLKPYALMQGGAPTGPDAWAWEWGLRHLPSRYNVIVRANWRRYGKKAGRMRNSVMAERVRMAGLAGWDVEVHAWWSGDSAGTQHMIDVAGRRRLKVIVHTEVTQWARRR